MRHAFLVIAHNNFEILEYLLRILDDPNTDFYIHIDKRASYSLQDFKDCVQRSNLIFLPSKKIKWGGYSQIDCEMRLLKASAPQHYDYYHLISGVDMPLHTIKEMNIILSQNSYHQQYVHFDSFVTDPSVLSRIQYYHLMPGRKNWQKKIDGMFVKVQKLCGVNRLKDNTFKVQKGTNWFSITDELVQSILRNEKWVKKHFKWTFCGDEVFLQTYVYNSKFKEQLASLLFDNKQEMCLRKIDWERGNPYVFRVNDYKELMQSGCLFARKFDWKVDFQIVEKIYRTLKERT